MQIPPVIETRIQSILARFDPEASADFRSTSASSTVGEPGVGSATAAVDSTSTAQAFAGAMDLAGGLLTGSGGILGGTSSGLGLSGSTLGALSIRSANASTPAAGTAAATDAGPIATTEEVKAIQAAQTYSNGRLPDDALTSIGVGSHRLRAPAASAFKQMRTAASADGVTIGVTDSYRSYDAQVDVARRKGLYSQGGLAAKPGTSKHGWGLALDLDLDGKALSWMRANGARFGFVADTPRESWHWVFDGVKA
ncbi:MAG: M15 family metallopeptidase [Microthrixaceae bacterium]